MLSRDAITISDYNIQVYGGGDGRDPSLVGKAYLLSTSQSEVTNSAFDVPVRQGAVADWLGLFAQYPGSYIAGSSRIYLPQSDGTEVVGTVVINPLDSTELTVNWDPDSISASNTLLDDAGKRPGESGFDTVSAHSWFNAIIDPTTKYQANIQGLSAGDRFLIIEDTIINTQAWENFIAHANDIIMWDGAAWSIIFDSTSAQEADRITCQTNIYTGVQYKWNGISWVKSFEGEYKAGTWRLEL